jgi:hypothetical protein
MSAADGGGEDASAVKISCSPSPPFTSVKGLTVIGPTVPSPLVLGLIAMLLKVREPTVQENPGPMNVEAGPDTHAPARALPAPTIAENAKPIANQLLRMTTGRLLTLASPPLVPRSLRIRTNVRLFPRGTIFDPDDRAGPARLMPKPFKFTNQLTTKFGSESVGTP